MDYEYIAAEFFREEFEGVPGMKRRSDGLPKKVLNGVNRIFLFRGFIGRPPFISPGHDAPCESLGRSAHGRKSSRINGEGNVAKIGFRRKKSQGLHPEFPINAFPKTMEKIRVEEVFPMASTLSEALGNALGYAGSISKTRIEFGWVQPTENVTKTIGNLAFYTQGLFEFFHFAAENSLSFGCDEGLITFDEAVKGYTQKNERNRNRDEPNESEGKRVKTLSRPGLSVQGRLRVMVGNRFAAGEH